MSHEHARRAPLLDYAEAVALLVEQDAPQRIDRLSLVEASGRFAAAAVALDRDAPAFDRATMDGYAIAPLADTVRYQVIGAVHAGEASPLLPRPGQALRIMTGAPCPPGCAVVPVECTDGGNDAVQVDEPSLLRIGVNIASRGEDGRSGDMVVAPGTRYTPAVLAAAAMAGARDLEVFAEVRVAVCTTGDEVGGDGAAGIADSNGPLLAALLREQPVQVARHHAGDTIAELRDTLGACASDCDVLVTTGGVSAGDRDLVPQVLGELGYQTLFHGLAIQPGKPVLVARHPDGRWAVGLPGNPVSVLATAHLILLPVLGRFWAGWAPAWCRLPLVGEWTHPKRRRLFLPAQLVDGGLQPLRWHGSGDLLAAAHGDGLVDLDPGGSWVAGESVPFLPWLGGPLLNRAVLPASRRP